MIIPVFQWEVDASTLALEYNKNIYIHDVMKFASQLSFTWYFIAIAAIYFFFKRGFLWTAIRISILSLGVGVADAVARYGFKATFKRPRPAFLNLECLSSECWGFVSNHATNMAVAATILIAFNRKNAKWAIPLAALVGLSRVILGKHYPLDVIGGFVVGAVVGLSVVSVAKVYLSRHYPDLFS